MNRHKFIYIIPLIATLISGTVLPGCHSLNKTQKGANIGAGAGGSVGALVGRAAGNTALGAVIGGAVGGTAGAFIGRNMDKQATEIQQKMPGATVIREGGAIIIKFDSGILFDAGKTDIKPAAQTNLQNLAASLQTNIATDLLIIGHTDNREGTTDRKALSVSRAQSVKDYLGTNGIDTNRLHPLGEGDTDPVGDNKTVSGRAQNRRVEIVIVPSDRMKKEAVTSGK